METRAEKIFNYSEKLAIKKQAPPYEVAVCGANKHRKI